MNSVYFKVRFQISTPISFLFPKYYWSLRETVDLQLDLFISRLIACKTGKPEYYTRMEATYGKFLGLKKKKKEEKTLSRLCYMHVFYQNVWC